jgi:hypothetical protein
MKKSSSLFFNSSTFQNWSSLKNNKTNNSNNNSSKKQDLYTSYNAYKTILRENVSEERRKFTFRLSIYVSLCFKFLLEIRFIKSILLIEPNSNLF